MSESGVSPMTDRPADSTGGAAAPAIRCEGVTKVFGRDTSTAVEALGPIDLQVEVGEFLCIVGPSGCGKSTLVRMIAGLSEPTTGSIDVTLKGTSPTPVATVFQDFGIFPWKTVEANVEFGLKVRGVGRAERRERTDRWLNKLGLLEFRSAYPRMLSGGMRQRVAIARALATEPEILLMDEPFASLDVQRRELLQEELLALVQSDRRTVVFVTHSLEEALVLGDRVVVMTARPGRTLYEAPVPFSRPRTPQLREEAEFTQMRGALWDQLKTQVLAPTEDVSR